jgi:hypothetical protein
MSADAEGRLDLSALADVERKRPVYLFTPIVSPNGQEARLVLDTSSGVRVWLNGQSVALSRPGRGAEPHAAVIHLPRGKNDLLIHLPGVPGASLVTTVVSDKPVSFQADEAQALTR